MFGAFQAQAEMIAGAYRPPLGSGVAGKFAWARRRAPGNGERGEGVPAKMKNDCSTTSCALACCVAAKEGYSSGFSNACRPDAAIELRFSHKLSRVLYRTSVCIGAGRRGFWRKTEVEPKFSRAPTPSAEIAVRMQDPVLRRQAATMMERKAFDESSRALPSARERTLQARAEFSQGFDRYWKSPIALRGFYRTGEGARFRRLSKTWDLR